MARTQAPQGAPAPGDAAYTPTGRSRLVRLVVLGGLIAAGWLLAVIFGFLWATPASADSYVVTSHHVSHSTPHLPAAHPAGGSYTPHVLHGDGSANAEAMAGRGVEGLTSQSTPTLPTPASADHGKGVNGLMPQSGGGSGPFGPGLGDVARSSHDPRLMVLPAPIAAVLPPVVRAAADDPSFSPD
ncbi:MAG TPA: hypothetical protein VIR33_13010 [Thermopolyspora sp.]